MQYIFVDTPAAFGAVQSDQSGNEQSRMVGYGVDLVLFYVIAPGLRRMISFCNSSRSNQRPRHW